MVEGKGVSFVDLISPHLDLEEELIKVVRRVLRSGVLAGAQLLKSSRRTSRDSAASNIVLG